MVHVFDGRKLVFVFIPDKSSKEHKRSSSFKIEIFVYIFFQHKRCNWPKPFAAFNECIDPKLVDRIPCVGHNASVAQGPWTELTVALKYAQDFTPINMIGANLDKVIRFFY